MTQFPVKRFREMQTPFYYYDLALLGKTLDEVRKQTAGYDFYVHYAVKANANEILLAEIRNAGLGIDCVSGGEIKAAVDCGFNPAGIVFAGVGKTDAEIEYALSKGIGCFNIESVPELENIAEIAARMGVKANVAVRVNPNIDAHTHEYITTGLCENKFGIDMSFLDGVIELIGSNSNLHLKGLHFHIGSQITDMTPYILLCDKISSLTEYYRRKGVYFETINVGGGLGIDYDSPDRHSIPDFKAYFDVFKENLSLEKGQQLHFELGRAIVGQCGSLITKVLYVKEGIGRKFIITDAGMTDLIRPALYQAHHKIENITSGADGGRMETYDVVGPICESSDVFGKDERLPETRRGDLLALRSAGAYGEIMASQYNLRCLPGSLAF